MRLIDADALDAAFTALRFNSDGSLKHWGNRPDWCLHGKEIETLLKDAPTVGGWTSVKDMVPETNDEVLTTYVYADKPGKRYVEAASYLDDGEGEGHWYSVWDEYRIGGERQTVIAWMPMPKPYMPDVKA